MVERERLALPAAPNEVWSIDFVMDALSNGRRLKCMTIVDDFTKEAVDIGVSLKLIQAGKPTQIAYIESFNGKFRDECLNEHWFTSLPHARTVIAAWRQDYNGARPHSALNYQPPAEFAARYRATAVAPAVQEQT